MGMTPIDTGSGDGDAGYKPLAEINVTPFVDVMLVLLIIFMVAAPLMMVGVPVRLPKTTAASAVLPQEPIVVTIDAEGRVYLGEEETTLDVLTVRLAADTADDPDRVVYVRGDQGLSYGRIMEVMGEISSAGIARMSLIAEGSPTAENR